MCSKLLDLTYKETVAYLYQQLPAYQKVGKSAFKKDLTNIIKLCEFLDNPHLKFKSVHIAGTNGKGSCAHMLCSIFQEAGYTTGLYTSPHLVDFRERIKIDGNYIHKNTVISFVKKIQPILHKIQPSFFEITVAMAFHHFAKQKVDIAIIETGLGGRLDSTNIISPIISLITNIGLEHQHFLGDTLEKIAGEKAGIIKSKTPVVIGEYHKSTAIVFKEKTKQESASIYFAKDYYKTLSHEYQTKYSSQTILDISKSKQIQLKSDLKASYQSKNILSVLTAIDIINQETEFSISKKAIKKGIRHVTKNTNFLGRWQQINSRPTVVLDCAHNADGIKEIVQQLQIIKAKKIYIIYGCVSDKDLEKITKLLPKKASYYLTEPKVARAKPVIEIAAAFKRRKLNIEYSSTYPIQCLKQALKQASKEDFILITGSVFLVASFVGFK